MLRDISVWNTKENLRNAHQEPWTSAAACKGMLWQTKEYRSIFRKG